MSRTTNQTDLPIPPTQLDHDEKRVLAECERESLIYRSIPLGLISFFATQYAMTKNLITPQGKWIKLGASLFLGYIIGKVSYAPTCRNKILTQIPNSNLAYAIRGVEIRHESINSDEQQQQQQPQPYISRKPKDPSEAVVFLPDPVELDTHTVPVGINQYGDPIYDTTK
ncbi:unnamed protein product [Rotaria sp. Silwood1]|nr:unnamed protein product [Rotaria sp. Silwood1]CAF3411553.1 unnamed protein product [Rotaria sp. Silwood1]CAF3455457.1 unnamed protein product [Rotaria sp. Silwood1]CAF4588085.1 unnamed protein product [Rotaria sp. Silwood1]CAF4639438.1 unnamed protein product [Rotaria sp. Silwood1]